MLKRIIFLLVLSFAVSEIYAEKLSRALVQIGNDLWIVDKEGKPVRRLTFDGEEKFAAAWSPDGSIIAYGASSQARRIDIIDSEGRAVLQLEINNPSVTAVMRLGWAGPRVLWYEGHGGPHGSVFGFWEVPSDIGIGKPKLLAEGIGIDCVLSPNQDVACTEQGGVRINDKFIYPEETSVEEIEKFEGGLAWDPSGQHLGAVERTKSGRSLILINRVTGERGHAVEWQVAKKPLSVDIESIKAIEFDSTGKSVILEGKSKVYELPIESGNSIQPKVSPRQGLARTFPRKLKVRQGDETLEVKVLDWYPSQKRRVQ